MDLVAGAVRSVGAKLLQLLGNEYKLQRGVKKNIKSLSDELKHIQAFLHKVSEVPWDQLDEPMKEWASDIREASYDLEDILDTFLVRVEGCELAAVSRLERALRNMTDVFSFSKGKARHDVGSSIQDIMKQLQDIADRRARYRIDDVVVNSAVTMSTSDPRLKAMYNEVGSLVGIEEPSKDLIYKLSASQGGGRKKKTVSIVGTGGLGKTTLAKAVFDKLRADFECWAFVPVGRNLSQTKVLGDILYELDNNKYADIHTKNRDKRQLINNIREFLLNKRYFIVIDDIWEDESWKETIELALLENNCGSRIIVTTRNSSVATEIADVVYKMQKLSDNTSKKLFYTRIFGAKEMWPDTEPDQISYEILKKCDGVPLAIITMASLLVGKPRDRWFNLYTAIGFGHEVSKQAENAMKILSYSYYDLPSYLRRCLLYLSVFPEDHTIDKYSLIWKWIAEGFIQHRQEIWLYDLGERYFNDLVNRSMIQVRESTVEDKFITSYHVHDMVRDLLHSISCRENFLTVVDNHEGTISQPTNSARRLALHNKTKEHSTPHDNVVATLKVIRSFTAYICDFDKWAPLSSFKLLRVLAMENCNLSSSHVKHIRNLLQLRYLGLIYTYLDVFPNEIGDLKYLQILNLNKAGRYLDLTSISGLTRLLCLKLDYCNAMYAPDWIENLKSLEELQISIFFRRRYDNYESRVCRFLNALGRLKELRVFRCFISRVDDNMQRYLVLSLRNLHNLQHFKFSYTYWQIDTDTAMWGEAGFVFPRHFRVLHLEAFKFSYLPSCISAACLPNLTHLSLTVHSLDEVGLGLIGRLPELYRLYLDTDSMVTLRNISANNGYFQKLRIMWMASSMIQFLCEADSSVSFHIGWQHISFGSTKDNSRVPKYVVMPNLEMIRTSVSVEFLKAVNVDCCNIGFEYLPSLQKVIILTDYHEPATGREQAKTALRKAIEVHPNRPTVEIF